MKKKLIYSIVIAFFAISCNQTATSPTDNTPTRGKVVIGVDNSYKLLLDTEISTFQAEYKYANITAVYKPELEILEDFMNDTLSTIITGRELTKGEIEYFNSKQVFPKTTKIAYDAIAFITNKNNRDSLISYNEIRDIFTGKITKWSEIKKDNKLGAIKVVFDSEKSGNVSYIAKKLEVTKFPSTCASVDNNQAVIDYVATHPNAIGVVSVNWISDTQDSVSHSFLNKIQVLAVSNEIEPDGPNYYRPYAGFVADKSYPFVREVFVINKELYTGLGSGFASYISGEKGQRIILKSGMVPAIMPVRLIQLKEDF